MLNAALLRRVASVLANTNDFRVIELGAGNATPTKNDTGISGALVRSEQVTVTVEGNIIKVSTAVFPLTSGIAQEVVVKAADGQMRDRQLIAPIPGSSNTQMQIEYLLEPLGNG